MTELSAGHPANQGDMFPDTHGSQPQSKEALAAAKADEEAHRLADLRHTGREELAWLAATLVRIGTRLNPEEVALDAVEDRTFSLGGRSASAELIAARTCVLETCPLTAPLPVVFRDTGRSSAIRVVDGQSWISAARALSVMVMTMIVVKCDEGRARLLAHAINAQEKRPLARKAALAMELFAAQPALLTQPVRALTSVFGCSKSTIHRARSQHNITSPDDEAETPSCLAPVPLSSPAPEAERAAAEPPASDAPNPPRAATLPRRIPSQPLAVSPAEVHRHAAAAELVFAGFNAQQRSQLEALLGGIEGAARQLKLGDPTLVYPVLDALMPNRAR